MTEAVVYTGTAALSAQEEQQLMRRLPPAVCRHIASRCGKRRTESLLAYAALWSLFSENERAHLSEILYSPGKKPRFGGGLREFNLSHTEGAVAAVLSDRPVGIDVQRITEPKPAVVRRLFTREEQLELQNAASAEQGRLFTRFWVKKEAAVKQTGRGLSGLHDPAADSAVFTFAEGDDWVLCVCGEESAHIPVFHVEELLSHVL